MLPGSGQAAADRGVADRRLGRRAERELAVLVARQQVDLGRLGRVLGSAQATDEVQGEVCGAVTPPAVMIRSGSLSRSRMACGLRRTCGYAAMNRSRYAQWLAHVRPSSRPDSASRTEPVHTEVTSAPPSCIRASQAISCG